MIFISESGLLDPARKAEWDAWYVEHLRVMLTVPGISSAQRLETDTPGYPPSLAIYTVLSADVFTDPYYLSIRGFGDWQPLIDQRAYRRNLFAGLDRAPEVQPGQLLQVADRSAPDRSMSVDFQWLECVALDHSTPYRGLAVVNATQGLRLDGVAVYAPVTQRLMSSESSAQYAQTIAEKGQGDKGDRPE